MIIEHRTYLDNSEEFYFFNSPKLKTTEDVKQLYKLRSPEYITHTPAKLYGRDEYNYYASEFIETPYDPEDGLIYPEHFKPTREEFRAELIRLGIIFNNYEDTDSMKTAFNTATTTAEETAQTTETTGQPEKKITIGDFTSSYPNKAMLNSCYGMCVTAPPPTETTAETTETTAETPETTTHYRTGRGILAESGRGILSEAFHRATTTARKNAARNFKAWRELKYGKDGE